MKIQSNFLFSGGFYLLVFYLKLLHTVFLRIFQPKIYVDVPNYSTCQKFEYFCVDVFYCSYCH